MMSQSNRLRGWFDLTKEAIFDHHFLLDCQPNLKLILCFCLLSEALKKVENIYITISYFQNWCSFNRWLPKSFSKNPTKKLAFIFFNTEACFLFFHKGYYLVLQRGRFWFFKRVVMLMPVVGLSHDWTAPRFRLNLVTWGIFECQIFSQQRIKLKSWAPPPPHGRSPPVGWTP